MPDKKTPKAVKPTKSAKSAKSVQVPAFSRSSKKVTCDGKQRTIYIRSKDGAECVRSRDKEGKMVYKKLRVSKRKSGGEMNDGALDMQLSEMATNETSINNTQTQSFDDTSLMGGCGCAGTQPPSLMGGACGPPSLPVGGYQDGAGKALEKNKRTELYQKAKKYEVKGRSRMNKDQLARAVRAAHKAVGERIRRKGKGKKTVSNPLSAHK